ncbi:pentapeptide repeat-containing protein [Kitasatospora sp. NPDC059577]|uniref:pentapeptide repeat-containing protein n=1 Tax=Kitasatospora sp. NPDC059577 TaxID=3346873 RepID=UPI003682C57D
MKSKRVLLSMAATAALGALVLFIVALWRIPWWLDHHYLTDDLTPAQATAVSGMRTALVTLGAGLLVTAGLFYTHRTLELTREGHVTDRFTKAVEQLGSTVLEVRLGGVYSLERIMHDSPKDYQTVLEVVAAFVRERAIPLQQGVSTSDPRVARALRRVSQTAAPSVKPTTDVQAALTVLGRRTLTHRGRHPLDLSNAHLEGSGLMNADLSSTILVGAHLEGANLSFSNLRNSLLVNARLDGALMAVTQMQGALLAGARLRDAMMVGANLDDADLKGAVMDGALLATVDLTNVKNLTVDQIVAAKPDSSTRLPSHLATDERVRERIRHVEAAGESEPA